MLQRVVRGTATNATATAAALSRNCIEIVLNAVAIETYLY